MCGELTHRRETEEQREREKRERREKERGREGRGEKGRKERREQGAWGGFDTTGSNSQGCRQAVSAGGLAGTGSGLAQVAPETWERGPD